MSPEGKRACQNLERADTPGRQSDLAKTENMGTQVQQTMPDHNDALLQIKEYARVGFDQLEAGGPEVFEKLWARAFEALLDLGGDMEFPTLGF
jgi:hypothetical protein